MVMVDWARILSDMLLARGEKSELRFYNISSQINKDKKHYYDILERMQRGDGEITEWLVWYMKKMIDALDEAETIVTTILNKSFFWQKAASVPMTERQTQMLNLFLDGYEAKITSKTWASLAKCSKDTAIRDIQDLVSKNILVEDIPGAKRSQLIPLSLTQRTSHNSLPMCVLPKRMAYHISMPYSKGIEQFVKECWHLTQNGIKRENYLCPICSISTAHI